MAPDRAVAVTSVTGTVTRGWPDSDEELVELQSALALEAVAVLATDPWTMGDDPLIGGCFVAFARGEAGPGHPGDRAWAAAVAWRARANGPPGGGVVARVVVAGRVPASYTPGLLARREGPLLAAAVERLRPVPDVLLVDASGLDHPRAAGLAVHLGAVAGVPTVGVTEEPLRAAGDRPPPQRGATSPLVLDGRIVGHWVCTRTGTRPVAVSAGWRTDPATAAAVVLAASSEAARAPVPLQEARRAAREARTQAEAG